MNILAFDIETIPDVHTARKLYKLSDDVDDTQVAQAMFKKRQDKVGHDFLALHLHQIVAISVVYRNQQTTQCKVWSLGSEASNEKEIIQNFYDGIERYTPTLVSWNGGGFDLPVLHYRALKHGVQAARYWDMGDDDSQFKWNNYISRFHQRHIDLMDMLAAYQPRAVAPLDEMSVLLGLPGKMGMSGASVWEQYQQKGVQGIRDYCETDALNTYLLYLHFSHMRGQIDTVQLQQEQQIMREYLQNGAKHLQAFEKLWLSTQ